MARKKSFTVTNPPMLIWLTLVLMGFFVIVVVLNMLTTPPPHTAMIVAITIFIFIPCTLIILWTKFFRIRVEGTTIKVKRFFGLVNYQFDVSEITTVRYLTAQTRMGRNQKIALHTSTGKTVPVETLMINSEKMIKFIEENVDETKFRKEFKSFQ